MISLVILTMPKKDRFERNSKKDMVSGMATTEKEKGEKRKKWGGKKGSGEKKGNREKERKRERSWYHKITKACCNAECPQ